MAETGPAGEESEHLDEAERQQARDTKPITPLVIHEVTRAEGLTELNRSFSGLAWSGLSAGLSIGFSFLMQSAMEAALPDAPWRILVAGLGYTVGFLIVILGRQQLFTETTLTAALPAMAERSSALILGTLRVWVVVLVANVVGTLIIAAVLAHTDLAPPAMVEAMKTIAHHTMESGFGSGVVKAAFAGWLIGLMVWLLPGSGPARPWIIILLTYAVSVLGLAHIVAGSVEAAYLVFSGGAGVTDYLWRFFLPTLIGNCIGGTLLATLLNHAPVAGELTGNGGED